MPPLAMLAPVPQLVQPPVSLVALRWQLVRPTRQGMKPKGGTIMPIYSACMPKETRSRVLCALQDELPHRRHLVHILRHRLSLHIRRHYLLLPNRRVWIVLLAMEWRTS